MFKRLSISLLVMGLAAFGLGAAAFAWFSDSGTAGVQVSSGTANLTFRVDFDCDNDPGDWDTEFDDFAPPAEPTDFSWSGIVPGDTTADCIEVKNVGTTDLTVFVKHSGLGGGDGILRNATLWQYNSSAAGHLECPFAQPQDDQYDTDRGCSLGTVAPNSSITVRVDVNFPDNGNQDSLQGLSFNFVSTFTGYTS